MKWLKGMAVVSAVVLLMIAAPVKADSIIATLDSISLSSPGVFDWKYDVNFYDSLNKIEVTLGPNGQQVHPDFFAVLDVDGLIGSTFSAVTGTWVESEPLLSPLPTTGLPVGEDNPAKKNVQWTYTAGPTIFGGSPATPTFLGTLHISSTLDKAMLGSCVGGYERIDDQLQANDNGTFVPIPTPAAIWAGLALMGLVAVRKATR